MPAVPRLGFGVFAAPQKGVLIVLSDEALDLGPATRKALGKAADLVRRAAKAERFTGKSSTSLDLLLPEGLKVDRLVVLGIGKASEFKAKDALKLGGAAMGKAPKSAPDVTVFAELPSGPLDVEQAADLAQGIVLRAYAFDRYKTKRKKEEEEKTPEKRTVTVAAGDPAAARKAYAEREA